MTEPPNEANEAVRANTTGAPMDTASILPPKKMQWRTDMNVPPRISRFDEAEFRELIRQSWPPAVFMSTTAKAKGKTIDIVISFPNKFSKLSSWGRRAFRTLGVDLEDIFQEILWKPRRRKENAVWSRLASTGYSAYRQTWRRVLWLLFGEQLHPALVKGFTSRLDKFEASLKRSVGRREMQAAEEEYMKGRFQVLLSECNRLHQRVVEANAVEKPKGGGPAEVAHRVLMAVWRHAYRMRGGEEILGGRAFEIIPYARPYVTTSLVQPETWKPHQLAIALLGLERGVEYRTIERKIRPTKTKRPSC